MHAISIRQPWAYSIFYFGKDIENRTWACPTWISGSRVLIHASKTMKRGDWDAVEDACGVLPPSDLPRGAIVGSVIIEETCDFHGLSLHGISDRWYRGPLCWVLKDARPITEPIPCRGHLQFFRPLAKDFPVLLDYRRYIDLVSRLEGRGGLRPLTTRGE